MNRTKVLAVIVVAIIIIAAVGFYLTTRPVQLSVLVASSTSVGTTGSPITFTVILSPSSTSIVSVVWNFGDGANQTANGATITHTYANSGRYLVFAQVTASYQGFLFSTTVMGSNGLALFPLPVEPNVPRDQASEVSVPTINFPWATNPTAPVFAVGDVVNPVGGFLELPSNSNWAIQGYAWDFGNGNKQTAAASSETGLPAENVTSSYSSPGLYPLSLALTTASNGETFSVTTVRTIAVQSSSLAFALLSTTSGVTNPGLITSAEVVAGGPTTFDPQIVADAVSQEVIANIFQTLVWYNGSSTDSFIPYLAAALPTIQNGGIGPDFRTYTFQIRDNQYFSNGDPVTAYDVWFSIARGMAFAGGPTNDWITSQFLVPGVQNGTATVYANNTWKAAMESVTYDNASNTVTFHLNAPTPPALLFEAVADIIGGGAVLDAKYAISVGSDFNEANWSSFETQANSGSYNTMMQWSPVGSGPYMIKSYTPGQSLEFVPNPYYNGVPGIPKPNAIVVIDWVKTPDTALLMLQDGQADIVGGYIGLPPSDFPAVQKLQSQGLVNIYSFPTLADYWFAFNIKINKDLEATQLGSQFNEPSNYFADLPTRFAWINSFDYQGYLDNILGNKKYGATFGIGYKGTIPPGIPYYVPPDQLGGLPTQNLDAARGNFSLSAWHDRKITLPIALLVGDSVTLAAAEEWASMLSQISGGNITATPVQLQHPLQLGDIVPDMNPQGVYFQSWELDYPYPSDPLAGDLQQGGFFTGGNDWTVSNFASLPPPNPHGLVQVNGSLYTQAQVYAWLNGNITLGNGSVDPAVIQKAYKTVEQLEIAMGLYAYVVIPNQIFYFRSWLHGYQYNENPIQPAGGGGLLYFWLAKPAS